MIPKGVQLSSPATCEMHKKQRFHKSLTFVSLSVQPSCSPFLRSSSYLLVESKPFSYQQGLIGHHLRLVSSNNIHQPSHPFAVRRSSIHRRAHHVHKPSSATPGDLDLISTPPSLPWLATAVAHGSLRLKQAADASGALRFCGSRLQPPSPRQDSYPQMRAE